MSARPLIVRPTCAVVYVRKHARGRRIWWKLFIHSYHFNVAGAVREATKQRNIWPGERIWIQKQSAGLPGKVFGGAWRSLDAMP